jgi:Tfp pilus assembly protein PilF
VARNYIAFRSRLRPQMGLEDPPLILIFMRISRSRRSVWLPGALVFLVVLAACSQDPVVQKQAYLDRAGKYLAERKYNEAIVEARNALKIDPNLIPALRLLGRAYAAKGWEDDAARELSKAARLQPASLPILAELGKSLLAL